MKDIDLLSIYVQFYISILILNTTAMESVLSQRGNTKFIHNGYIYVFQKDLANDIRSFECEKRRGSGTCKARVKVNLADEVVAEMNDHTHPPSALRVEDTKIKSRIKHLAENTATTPQNILAEALGTASEGAMANLPIIPHLKRTIRHQRKENDVPPLPPTREAIPDILPFRFQETDNHERFLLFDSGANDGANRMIIYSSENGIERLRNSHHWFCDGTFKVCPDIFFQLYSVHARINGRILPSVYALLPNKTRLTYTRFFEEISNHMNDHTPVSVLFDFELAAIDACVNTFPDVEVTGCFFHLLLKNFRKKIQSSGLQNRYMQEPAFALHLKMLPALAFVPPQDVVVAFEEVTDTIRQIFGEQVDEVIDYLEDNYIGRYRRNAPRAAPTFAINLWNMFHRTHEEMPRTNNNVEGWHQRFQSLCMGHNLNFWKFLSVLKKEETLSRANAVQAEAGHQPPAQPERVQAHQRRILMLVDDYPNRQRLQYLRGIAHNIGH